MAFTTNFGLLQNQDPFGSALRGFQTGQAFKQQRVDRRAAAQQAEAQQALQEDFASVIANPNRTPEDIFRLAATLPEQQRKGFLAANTALGEAKAKNLLTFSTQVLSAFNAGATDIGLELLEERAIASENSGNEAEAQALRAFAEIAKVNPDAAFTTVAAQVATLPGGKDAIESILGARKDVRAARAGPKESALQQRIRLMTEQGVPLKRATDIATGVIVTSIDPISREATLLDKATGQRVEASPQEVQAAVAAQEPTVPVTPAAIPSAAPAVAPPVVPAAPPQPGAVQPDITEALGPGGFGQSAINSIVDFFGGNLPFEQTSEAAALLDNLNNETLRVASSTIDGRPSVFFQEKIQELLVPPNSLFNNKGEAFNRFRALSQNFVQEADRLQSDIDNQALQPGTIDAARTRISELRSLAGKYNAVVASGQPAQEDLPPLESFQR